MATGAHYVKAIDMVLDAELRVNQDVRDSAVARATEGIVAPFDIDPRSRRLTGAVKALKTKEVSSDSARRKVFRDRFPQLDSVEDGRLNLFISEIARATSGIDKELYKSRTELSTVSTVVRPLTTKWLDRWRATNREGFDYDRAAYRVELLMKREIDGIEALKQWMEDVYDLFNDLVIYRGAEGLNAPKVKGAPMGMVSIANERVYRRNWTNFKDRYIAKLLDTASKISGGDYSGAFEKSYDPVTYNSAYSYRASSSSPRMPFEPEVLEPADDRGTSGRFAQYTVRIESAESGKDEATKVWSSQEVLKVELHKFIDVITGTWDSFKGKIHVTLTFDTKQGETSVRVADKTPDDAVKAVNKLLDLAD